ncbi:hypothetical protein VUR80DRAFT_502 [Thermomyces stellatus]
MVEKGKPQTTDPHRLRRRRRAGVREQILDRLVSIALETKEDTLLGWSDAGTIPLTKSSPSIIPAGSPDDGALHTSRQTPLQDCTCTTRTSRRGGVPSDGQIVAQRAGRVSRRGARWGKRAFYRIYSLSGSTTNVIACHQPSPLPLVQERRPCRERITATDGRVRDRAAEASRPAAVSESFVEAENFWPASLSPSFSIAQTVGYGSMIAKSCGCRKTTRCEAAGICKWGRGAGWPLILPICASYLAKAGHEW